ncbi:MAG TPA: lipoprotein insertase outer membrane protein LolB [Gammaproteobacteria bacterium]|jgi:outer membrane lipoprotein LolB
MTRRRPVAVILFTLAATLAGCAHQVRLGDGMSYTQRRDYLESVGAWEMRGRIAVDTGESAFQGRFQWLQSGDDLTLIVRSPLGANLLRVAGPPEALIVDARGETWKLTSPEQELSEILGWWLPVTSFQRWLLGVPDPHYAAEERLGPDAALARLEQRLWQLEFGSYQLASGVLIPRRIDLGYDRLEFRVVVDSWLPSP